MIFGKKRQHPLPKFPPNVAPTFKALCEPLSFSEINTTLRSQVYQAIEELEKSSASNELIDLAFGELIAKRCLQLIDLSEGLPETQRNIIVGAVRYFACADDPVSEDGFATGLDDDARILNHVFEEIGEEEFYIRIP